jgi:aspartate kinase
VEFAKRYRVPLHVRSSFSDSQGTWVVEEEAKMEDVLVSGVSLDLNEAKVTLQRVPDRPGLASRIFTPIAEANIVVDMIIQNASEVGFTDVTFTVPKADLKKAMAITKSLADDIGAGGVDTNQEIAKVSVVGLGMRSHAGVAASMFRVLADNGINIQMISTSEIKVSVVVASQQAELAVKKLHEALVEKRNVE